MQNIRDKIKSLRDTVGVEYKRPDPEKLDKMIEELFGLKEVNGNAWEYLVVERGLDEETIKHFRLGYDGERKAIAIPIFKKIEGEEVLVNIKYRFLDPDKNKYTSEGGAETWIYNEDGIQHGIDKKSILIVEGEFDLMSVWQSGIRAVVSPASGKDSYGVWIEMLDNVPKIYIAYDNDNAGKGAGMQLAERLGIEKCCEISYPDGIKDANEYFMKHEKTEFLELMKESDPFYHYQFKGIGDVIDSLRNSDNDTLSNMFIPKVDIEKDWLIVVSGRTNAGKTSYVMNVADEFCKEKTPVLVFPFERGIESVGKRFLQVKFDKDVNDFQMMSDDEWKPVLDDCIDLPIYFSVPKKEDIVETIIKAKRLFDTRVVIVDHLDYMIRHVSGNRETEIANTLQNLKRVAEEHKIVVIIVTHIRKIDQAGAEMQRKAGIEDLKGSASLYQDPECVIMLDGDGETSMDIDVVKNKGVMESQLFDFNRATGKLKQSIDGINF